MNIGKDIDCPMCKANEWKLAFITGSLVIDCYLCKYQVEFVLSSCTWKVLNNGTLYK